MSRVWLWNNLPRLQIYRLNVKKKGKEKLTSFGMKYLSAENDMYIKILMNLFSESIIGTLRAGCYRYELFPFYY